MDQKPRHARALTFERGLNPRSNVNYEFRIANYELLKKAAPDAHLFQGIRGAASQYKILKLESRHCSNAVVDQFLGKSGIAVQPTSN